MRLYALTELHDPEAIELFITEEDARCALEDCLRDEPSGRAARGDRGRARPRPHLDELPPVSPILQEAHMERYVVATRLKPGAAPAAEELLSAGPPFDPGEAGLSAHAAYISNDYVFLVFEGEAAHATALQLAKEHVIEVSRWQDIVWELPSVTTDVPADARCLYRWPVDRSE